MSQDAMIYDDTPEAGCFPLASATLLLVAALLLILTACGGKEDTPTRVNLTG